MLVINELRLLRKTFKVSLTCKSKKSINRISNQFPWIQRLQIEAKSNAV